MPESESIKHKYFTIGKTRLLLEEYKDWDLRRAPRSFVSRLVPFGTKHEESYHAKPGLSVYFEKNPYPAEAPESIEQEKAIATIVKALRFALSKKYDFRSPEMPDYAGAIGQAHFYIEPLPNVISGKIPEIQPERVLTYEAMDSALSELEGNPEKAMQWSQQFRTAHLPEPGSSPDFSEIFKLAETKNVTKSVTR